ncbi:PREDICTED: uncharacterized protein LOC108568569 [Nicrophorus vespilloides]|uniref:Uncharacterized protein LOC108568569 n=1 Tax=Nicrophorus vespilloides TaxID=110193 RepID=A0ABM1NEI2_NICVS|nr:PREDICTED: uncharacterized protein LOC108568569 [Nicrophorus vespilloides]
MACVETFIEDVLRKEDLQEVSIEYGTSSGGFVGDVSTAVVHHSRGIINLFIKKNESELAKIMSKYETNFYEVIVPKLNAISGNSWRDVPKCYLSTETEIILENVCAKGFHLWKELGHPLSSEYIEAVLKCYGQFHGLSFALKQLEPEVFEEISFSDYEPMILALNAYKNDTIISNFTDIATKSFGEEDEECKKAFKKFINDDILTFLEELKAEDKYNVIVHGDCWTNNFMFREREGDIDVRMLDFQLARKASPIVDLSYFLTTSGCSKDVFNNVDAFLKIYHDALVNTLDRLHCDPDVFPFGELKRQWCKYGRYGTFWSMAISKMMIADKEEVEAAHTDRGIFHSFYFTSKNEAIYDERMNMIIKYFFK